MNSVEKETVLHCLKSMIDEEVCEECPLYGMTGTDHCEKDCIRLAINALEQEPCVDVISRQAVLDGIDTYINKAQSTGTQDDFYSFAELVVKELPPVTPVEKVGRCKDCKYFEYDSVAKVDGIPLIIAHEICSKWGDGCKTREDGYCFLFEPKMQEVEGTDEADT